LFPSGPHDEFVELCAVSTSDQLSQEDQERLREHLAACPSCREALQQYESIANDAIPAIAAQEASELDDPGPSWSQAKAEKVFFERLAQEEKREKDDAKKENNFRLMKQGQLVPDELVIDILQDRLIQSDCLNGVVLDGFPRNQKQAQLLDLCLAQLGVD
jgi:hypothetical protein